MLRRLLQRCGLRSEDVLQIATSATIGTGEVGELERFASKLFSKPQELVRVIRGQVQEVELPEIVPPLEAPTASLINERRWLTKTTQSADGKKLLVDAEQSDSLCNDLSLLVGAEMINEASNKAEDRPAALLYHTLGHAELLHRAKKIIDEKKRIPLRDYARQLWGDDSDESLRATVSLLQMGAAARQEAGAYPLLPHRLHVLARPTDGMIVCLNSGCSGESQLKLDSLGCVIAGYSDHCPNCRCATFSLYRCANCGEVALAGIKEGRRLLPVPTGNYQNETRYFTPWQASKAEPIFLDAQTGEMRGAGYDGLKVFELDACLNCDLRRHNGNEIWQPFVTSAPLTLSILAETALAELPELPEENNRWLPARGRRILAFSDSRPEAARLGPRLRLQHERQLVRAALARCAAQSPASDDSTIQFWRHQIVSLDAQLSSPSLSPALRQTMTTQLEQARREFESATQGGSIQTWLELFKNEASLREILHAETSHKHRPDEWRHKPKQSWDENFAGVESDLRRLIGHELASVPPRREFSVETIGLLEVTYPGLDCISLPPGIAGLLPALALDTLAVAWPDFLAALCDSLRTEGVVTLGGTKEDDDFQFGGIFIGRWCAEEKRRGTRLLTFIGARENHRRRRFTQTVLERCGLPAEQVAQLLPDLLRAAFRELKARAGNELAWLKKDTEPTNDGPVEALQIHFPSLALRWPPKLYRCECTGHIWPRSVLGCAPESIAGELREVTDDELDQDPRVGRQRRELKESQVFEHGVMG